MPSLHHRTGHYFLLLVLWACCCLINLGGPSLWDIDEGLNSEAAREMLDSGNLVVPTFNYQLRSAKPALLYWCQVTAYQILGVNEAAARLPSALAALLCMLTVYELGRYAFDRLTGLLAGTILGTSVSFLGSAHFANPDALLLTFSTLSLAFFYQDWQSGKKGLPVLTSIALGLAFLAKGPVGLVLPMAITILFLLWQRDLKHLLDWRLPGAILAFALIGLPWYIWVTLETRGVFLRNFFLNENINRFRTAMENHSGPIFYYLVVLIIGLAPWTSFLGPVIAHAWQRARGERTDRETAATRFLVVWVLVTLGIFSVASTKLPNYILPLYPAVALLTARMLVRWQNGEWIMPGWVMRVGLTCLALIGVGVSAGLWIISGGIDIAALRSYRMPDVAIWSWVGLTLPIGAFHAWQYLIAQRRERVIQTVSIASALFVGLIAATVLPAVNPLKPSTGLAQLLPADQEYHEVRLASFNWFQPSIVFYCRREISPLLNEDMLRDFLRDPIPGYVFLPEKEWQRVKGRMPQETTILGRSWDLYRRQHVVVVSRNPKVNENEVARIRRTSETAP